MKSAILGFVVALLLCASACAHAYLGWPQFRQPLAAAGVNADVIAGLAIGWYFGSASMVAFSGVVLHQAFRRLKGKPVQSGSLWVISVMYFIFGLSAYVSRAFNPHFLLFIATGVLVGLFSMLCQDRTSHVTDA